jgi:hypothetical protein
MERLVKAQERRGKLHSAANALLQPAS